MSPHGSDLKLESRESQKSRLIHASVECDNLLSFYGFLNLTFKGWMLTGWQVIFWTNHGFEFDIKKKSCSFSPRWTLVTILCTMRLNPVFCCQPYGCNTKLCKSCVAQHLRTVWKPGLSFSFCEWKGGKKHGLAQWLTGWWQLKYFLCSPLFG